MKIFPASAKKERTGAASENKTGGRAFVVRAPRITEKATAMKDTANAYAFVVADAATKPQVKREIEAMYKVHVRSVNIVRVPRKAKRLGRSSGFVPGYKKAIVSVKQGESISFT